MSVGLLFMIFLHLTYLMAVSGEDTIHHPSVLSSHVHYGVATMTRPIGFYHSNAIFLSLPL
jgi:hypothetical protein